MYNDELFEACKDYGFIDIPGNSSRNCFNLWLNNNQPVPIQCSGQPVDARWSGNRVIVEMDNGEVRSYYSASSTAYDIVRYAQLWNKEKTTTLLEIVTADR